MQVTFNNYNNYGKTLNRYSQNKTQVNKSTQYQPAYTGNGSKIFDPLKRGFDNLSEWLAKNYYARFYNSKFAKKFTEKTSNIKDMTKHMAALGSTLISGMYTVKTLQNDQLDPDRRKTLALNDILTWAISTIGAYTIDNALNKKWDDVTNRFTANYIKNNQDEIFTNQDFQKILKSISRKEGIKVEDLNQHIIKNYHNAIKTKDFDARNLNIYMDAYNKFVEKINKRISDLGSKAGKIKPMETISSIREFNLDVLKSRKLTTLIDGMTAFKSLIIFGFVYRYLVPVVVMKPANKLGAYMHKRREEKAQAENKTAKS